MRRRTVLICAKTGVRPAERVVRALSDFPHVKVHHADLGTHPIALVYNRQHTGPAGTINGLDLDEVDAVYWRFSSIPSVPANGGYQMLQWANRELDGGVHAGILGIGALWVNHPARAGAVTLSAVMTAAVRYGLDIPETLVATDPIAAKDFLARFGGCAMAKRYGARQRGSLPMRDLYRPMALEDLDDPAEPRPHIYREPIAARSKVRVFVIGAAVLCARTDCTVPGWTVESGRWSVLAASSLPQHVALAIPRMMITLAVVYATFEFDVDAVGTWWLMEFNPRGAFGEIEDRTDLPVSAAIAEVLANGLT